ncbi:MAG: hypothetical protein QXU18_10330, partial [Thermoplasmatales archaeon]
IGIPTSAIKELERLSVKDVNARTALNAAINYKILKVDSSGDDGIIEAATKYGGAVVTNDRALRAILKRMNIRVTSVSKGVVRRL